ncbi:hypothetical protein KEM56_006217 [Ascosphaera pollenicola]|nr:hypothetical protein KEM56_006217 [Ascosphaera pollenicola]
MSVPITTFDHENWTEPHISFEELVSGRRTYLSRQDEEVSAHRRSIAASQKTIGILTKTITASPIIRYVLTASLWERRHWRDTIFVGETFVSIKTFHPDALSAGHLEDVVTISNFKGARILSAKVIGAPSNTTLEDTPSDDKHTLHGKGWPWNALVLALSSCELLFLTGNHRDGPRSTFATVWKPLPRNVSRMEQYGQFMAVDPSLEDKLLDPVKKERFFRIDGSILAMEFLYPPKRLSDTIILALLVFQDGHKLTHLIYTFDLDKGLSTTTSKSRELLRYPTGYYDPPPPPPIPIMMIPVTLPASYILATPLKAVLCKDVLTESPFIANELVPPNSRWVAWARPQRIGKWNTRHDDVYVCSDDGQLLFLSIGRSGDFTITPVDMIGTSLDTAFGILDAGPNKQNGDILVAAGSLGEGALFIAPARSTIQVVQRLPNWGHVCDCLVIPTKAFDIRWSGTAYEPQPRHRLFVCATNGDCRGSLTEIRHGFEAKIGFEIECGAMYPRNMFILPEANHCGKGLYVMITELVGSTLLYIAALGDDARVVDEEELGLDLKGETIMAGVTPSGILTHVTERELRMTRLDQNKKKVRHVFDSRIVAASIGANNHVATAMRDDAAGTTTVEIRHIDSSFETCSLRVPAIRPSTVHWEPVSLCGLRCTSATIKRTWLSNKITRYSHRNLQKRGTRK